MTAARWLVTGGAGYVGAHIVRALLSSGRDAVVVDDLSTGLATRLPSGADFIPGSILDSSWLSDVFRQTAPTGVIHLAARKSPTESINYPVLYARQNVGGVIALVEALQVSGVTTAIFSSSSSVYGTSETEYVDEDRPPMPESPYGESKLYGERLLNASALVYGFGVINLRYFNVVGAASPELRDTGGYNLLPLVFQALRRQETVRVFGGDYPTPDGTCIRDYVAVQDVAEAHVRAAAALEARPLLATYNVGRGQGSSVLEVLQAVRSITGVDLDYEITDRRPGDPARIVSRVDRIARDLGWTAERDLGDMVRSAWDAEPAR